MTDITLQEYEAAQSRLVGLKVLREVFSDLIDRLYSAELHANRLKALKESVLEAHDEIIDYNDLEEIIAEYEHAENKEHERQESTY